MYKIQVRKNVQGAIDYFLHDKELSVKEKNGVWVGRGAKMLGLVQTTPEERREIIHLERPAVRRGIIVTEQDLRNALHGYAPPSAEHRGRPLNGRYLPEGVRKCAWDIVLAPHKSVSVAALCLRDEHAVQSMQVRSAYDVATLETFQFMELLARRSNGSRPDIETFSLLGAKFDHEVSRRNDPQLHTHFLTMNATHDPHGNAFREWYALQTLQLYRQAREIDMVFQRALAQQLVVRGVDAKMMTIDGLPVTVLPGVDPAVCHRLSRAHHAIQDQVAGRWQRDERGIIEKRMENRFNDRLRPSKTGTLAMRSDMFERALSPAEARQIVSNLYINLSEAQAPRPNIGTPSLLPDPAVRHLVLQAGRMMGCAAPTPAQISRTAIIASAESPEISFLQFWTSARWHLAKMFDMPWDDASLGRRVQLMLHYWRPGEENYFLHEHKNLLETADSVFVRTQNLPTRHPLVDTHGQPPLRQADEIRLVDAYPQRPPEIPPSYVPDDHRDHLGPRL